MISIRSLLLKLTAFLPLSYASNVFAQQRGDYGCWGIGPGMMGDGMVWYDLYARPLGLGGSRSCLSHQMADSGNQQWQN